MGVRNWSRSGLARTLLAGCLLASALVPLLARPGSEELAAVTGALGGMDHEVSAIMSTLASEAARPLRAGPDAARDFVAARDRGMRVDGPVRVLRESLADYARHRPDDDGLMDAEVLVERMADSAVEAYAAQARRIALARKATTRVDGLAFAVVSDGEAYREASLALDGAAERGRQAGASLGEWISRRMP